MILMNFKLILHQTNLYYVKYQNNTSKNHYPSFNIPMYRIMQKLLL